ncbi:chromatin-binding protein RAD9 LALA0_S04e05446g [Lachancea lanzarotensis]|uniref:LALA0S04e05446g1_1 n=1 Tax=Lachancea lanzarotensis TaxID=1245769 RepID=A0A0C7MQ64_9SACH|nr:uncharacterized protein LALA0_S04e05446g [Lachancea lanzarotensis]CEP62000.1 LALA0S04e05446g1_1 [Lachancea lanzarotensis]
MTQTDTSTNEDMDADDYHNERDQVVGETPKGVPNNLRAQIHRGDTKKVYNTSDEIESDDVDRTVLSDAKTVPGTSVLSTETPSKAKDLTGNLATPSLNRVKAFFRNKNIAGHKTSDPLVAQQLLLETSPLDTPQSQRIKPDFGTRKISPTSLIRNMRENQAPDLSRNTSGFLELNEDVEDRNDTFDHSNTHEQISGNLNTLGKRASVVSLQSSPKTTPQDTSDIVPTSGPYGDLTIQSRQDKRLLFSQAIPAGTIEGSFPNTDNHHQTAEITTQPIDTTDEKLSGFDKFDGSATQIDNTFIPSALPPEEGTILSDHNSPFVTKSTLQQNTFLKSPIDNSTPSRLIPSPKNDTLPLSSIKTSNVHEEHDPDDQDKTPSKSDNSRSRKQLYDTGTNLAPDTASELDESERRIRLRFSNGYEQNKDCEIFESEKVDDNVIYSDVEKTQDLPEVEDVINRELMEDINPELDTVQGSRFSSQRFDTQEIVSSRKAFDQASSEASQEVVKNRRLLKKKRLGARKLDDTVEQSAPKKAGLEISPKRLKTGSASQSSKLGSNAVNEVVTRTSTDSRHLYDDTVMQESTAGLREPATEVLFPLLDSIRNSDSNLLTRKDIRFQDAVWCYYDFNCMYYPGKVYETDPKLTDTEVLFESGISEVKRDDLHYLDVTVGETVLWEGKPYEITALECRSENVQKVIRCVRGYDTVHLKRKNKNGELGKRTLVRSLSLVTLTVELWAKRPKIILSGDTQNREEAFEDLRYPKRGRKYTTVVTPLTPSNALAENVSGRESSSIHYAPHSTNQNSKAELNANAVSPHSISSESGGVFRGCLFVLSGLSDQKRSHLSSIIEQEKGIVLKMSFSHIIDFTNKVHGLSGTIDFASIKFAGLVTEKHSRSLKYLETLALGWPLLHYSFIEHCLKLGKTDWLSLFQFLLPAGESFRLRSSSGSKTGIVKSANIFNFYSSLLQDLSLKEQIISRPLRMNSYHVLVYGSSDLDEFVKFAFQALGAASLKFCDTTEDIASFLKRDDEWSDFEVSAPASVKDNLRIMPRDCKALLFINFGGEKDHASALLGKCVKQNSTGPNIYIEGKEWLIQTIINDSTGHDDV